MPPFIEDRLPMAAQSPKPSFAASTPIKSILRQKRPLLDSDPATPDLPPSPSKRRKVLFSPNVMIQNVPQSGSQPEFGVLSPISSGSSSPFSSPRTPTSSSPSPTPSQSLAAIRAHVQQALEEMANGYSDEYNTIREYFVHDRHIPAPGDDETDVVLQPHQLRDYVLALAARATTLKLPLYRTLVSAILNCAWVGRDDAFVDAYIDFLAAMVTVRGSFLNDVLNMIVDRFTLCRSRSWSVPNFPPVSMDQIRTRLHKALHALLRMFPSARAAIAGVVQEKFPLIDRSRRAYLAYVTNLLRINDYYPSLGSGILVVIIRQLVDIDVEMQLDLDDLDDHLARTVQRVLNYDRVFDESDADADDSDASDADSVYSDDEDDEYHEALTKIKHVKYRVDKLDTTMNTLFAYFTQKMVDPDTETTMHYIQIFLTQFHQIILQTRKSRHTQFLLFHFVQKSDVLMEKFISTCETIAFRSNEPSVIKDYAISYLASFLARGSRVPAEMIRGSYERILLFLERLRRSYEPACRGPDVTKYYTYYATSQAALYIFCFRWKDLIVSVSNLIDPEDPLSYAGQNLNWGRSTKSLVRDNIYSRLNPLKVCAPGIVEEFAKLAHKLNFVYVYPLLEKNKRVRLSQFRSASYSHGSALRDARNESSCVDDSALQLDAYFPFDPYQLPMSKHWIAHDYLVWTPIPGLNDDDDSDEEEDSEAGDDVDDADVDDDDHDDDKDPEDATTATDSDEE